MFTILISAALFSLVCSFFCSLAEAGLYSVPLAHIRHQAESGSRVGQVLLGFKENIGEPISAILVLNTVANILGATVVGAEAAAIWGSYGVVLVSASFTILLLVFSEILPKILGAVYAKQVSRMTAYPLLLVVKALSPLMKFVENVTAYFNERNQQPKVSEEEVVQMANLGAEEGTIGQFEEKVITNVISLDKTTVREVLTPRVNVFRLDESLKLGDVAEQIEAWTHSRIPVHSLEDPDHLTGYVRQRDVYRAMMAGQNQVSLKDLARPITTVPELKTVDKLLHEMFEKHEHICAVADEHGALAGIVTLEDILEEIVGREIIDEYDPTRDMVKRS